MQCMNTDLYPFLSAAWHLGSVRYASRIRFDHNSKCTCKRPTVSPDHDEQGDIFKIYFCNIFSSFPFFFFFSFFFLIRSNNDE